MAEKNNKKEIPLVDKIFINAVNPATNKLQEGIYYKSAGLVKFGEKQVYPINELKNITYL